jgi:amylosucrase
VSVDPDIDRRIEEWRDDAESALRGLYGERGGSVLAEAIEQARAASAGRGADLQELDRARQRDADWFQRPERVGYIAYADRFGVDLAGVARRIPYLCELGVDVLHLMSVLRPRAGENDGGYAVDDYRNPDPALGTLGDLQRLIGELHRSGISLCLDLVMNHTSADHEWAKAAKAGSAYHRRLYRIFPDRTMPDAYEATLPEVFPDLAPGNFTWVDELGGWVWTTFREFQWDLDWSNPDVFAEMIGVVLFLANLGVDVLRLDAVAFTGKRIGTNSQNQPEAHLVAQALRAVLAMAAPATIMLAEAIVAPDDLVAYLGRHRLERRECELAYHNQLMVQGWSMLAEGRVALATEALGRLPEPPPRTTWLTYVRCHDDIGWAISDRDAAAVGLDGPAHRRFLAAFFRGDYWQSFARGAPFSSNPETGDERTSGMASTLCGIAAALELDDDAAVRRGVDRLLLLYGLAFGFGGIPMIYMGDELGQGDDPDWANDPLRATDSRWRHRPRFADQLAADRNDPSTVAGMVWRGLRRLVVARRSCRPLHGAGVTSLLTTSDDRVFGWRRDHPRFGTVLGLANVSDQDARVERSAWAALGERPVSDVLAPGDADLAALGGYQLRWLTCDLTYRTEPAPET